MSAYESGGPIPVELMDAIEATAKLAARQEIASMAGLVLRRSQEVQLTRLEERNIANEAVREALAQIFGEVLSDFSGHTGDGSDPGN